LKDRFFSLLTFSIVYFLVGENAASHAADLLTENRQFMDGYGTVGSLEGFQSSSSYSSSSSSKKNAFSKHSTMDVETRNQRSSQTLR